VPPTNLGLVESALEAWNRGDFDGFATHVADDVVWIEVTGRPETEGTELLGRERLRRGLATLFDAWESYHLELERTVEAADRVVAIVRETGRGRASGVEIDGRWGYVISVEAGLIARVEAYRDPDLALAAVSTGKAKTGA
jgi:ketosteroid isomerase-like protein